MKLLLLIVFFSILGCKESVVKKNNSDSSLEMKRTECIERIFAKDSFLGNVRNHASEKIPLKDALNNYTSELESLDYTNCPENFISAFQDHINAWKKVAEISSKYPSLRGELHDIFLQLEKSKDSIELKSLVKQVWDTWSKVEESASNQS
ncbi:hypothetical protein RXV94_12935 [Yeosuana sp. MJ-SS3]|uniref:Uncharacterized protein n=1 Tax=Gilvirhabdus luticola TaxID=3079858 RepID=A0ABU3U9J7_9FLAO|nr:hypothetical protein [Yeosuana sp. MJ-SS3]MDU8887068.1 hypothetical protein [Yeosuana sp. MJ-SS3]